MHHTRLYSIVLGVVIHSTMISAVNIKYAFKNETPYDVSFRGTFAPSHNCLSSDFVINLYPRGFQAMERPCMIASFDVEVNKDGKRIQIGSYLNNWSDTRNQTWKLVQTIHEGRQQFHMKVE